MTMSMSRTKTPEIIYKCATCGNFVFDIRNVGVLYLFCHYCRKAIMHFRIG